MAADRRRQQPAAQAEAVDGMGIDQRCQAEAQRLARIFADRQQRPQPDGDISQQVEGQRPAAQQSIGGCLQPMERVEPGEGGQGAVQCAFPAFEQHGDAQRQRRQRRQRQPVVERLQAHLQQAEPVGHDRQPGGRGEQQRLAQPEGAGRVDQHCRSVGHDGLRAFPAGDRQPQGGEGETGGDQGRGVIGAPRPGTAFIYLGFGSGAQQVCHDHIQRSAGDQRPTLAGGRHFVLRQPEQHGAGQGGACRVDPQRLAEEPG